MNFTAGILMYLAVGVCCVIIGEIGSRKCGGDVGSLTVPGFILVVAAWPILLLSVTVDVVRRRRGNR